MNIRKITYGGLLIAVAILLPQAFHLTGFQQAGQVFLPMHIPVLLGGFVLGPVFGLCIGILSPIISSFLTAMPPAAILPYMIAELAAYGLAAGLLYETLRLRRFKWGVYASLIGAMVFGRIVNALALFATASLFGLSNAGPVSVLTSAVTGAIGIAIQLVLIPLIVYPLERSGYLDRFVGRREKPSV